MLQSIKQLTALQLINLFGLNELRYCKDIKRKKRFLLMTFVWTLVLAMLLFYIVVLASGLAQLGLGNLIPSYLFATAGFMIFFFTVFKASSVIFQMRTYELLISLPVRKSAIIISRFLTMYVTNLLMSSVIVIPGLIVYTRYESTNFAFYLLALLGVLLLPLLPITVAVAIGALITAISSRMRHKSLISALLTTLFALGMIIMNTNLSNTFATADTEMLLDLSALVTAQIQQLYPPAIWYGNACVYGDLAAFFALACASIGSFLLVVAVLQHYFVSICTAIHATTAKNNYQLSSLRTTTPLFALCKRELKRYFASSVYVTNTIIGYILMVVVAATLLFMGVDGLEQALGMPGIVSMAYPYALSAMAIIMPLTSCSISMEGPNWWILQSLPVHTKQIWDGKMLAHLSIAAPFYVVSILLSCIALPGNFLDTCWLIVLPAIYILFSSVLGITINLAFPLMEWENEVRVVKQSAATMITMLIGILTVAIPMASTLLLAPQWKYGIMTITFILLLAATLFLYRKNAITTLQSNK